jgi:hypothetical protein
MANINDINFTKFSSRILPPDKRNPIITAFLNALLSPLQWIANLWLVEYTAGTTAANWSNARQLDCSTK